MQDKVKARTGTLSRPPEDLPYRVELGRAEGAGGSSACSLNMQLARAIFKAAQSEHPERRITLRKSNRIVLDSSE
jgi:hypothetical protein